MTEKKDARRGTQAAPTDSPTALPAEKSIVALMPSDTPHYMFPAWFGCISWAIGEADVVQAFRDETGNNWKPGQHGIERMIDEATGAEWHFVEAFIRWVNERVWGPIDGLPAELE